MKRARRWLLLAGVLAVALGTCPVVCQPVQAAQAVPCHGHDDASPNGAPAACCAVLPGPDASMTARPADPMPSLLVVPPAGSPVATHAPARRNAPDVSATGSARLHLLLGRLLC